MASRQDFWEFFDDFIGTGASISTSALYGSPWVVADVSSTGTPTYVIGADAGSGSAAPGVAVLTFDNANEAQSIIMSFGGLEQFDIDDGIIYEARVKMGQASVTSGVDFSFGFGAGQNATWDSTTVMAAFRVVGATSTTAVVCETDDGTTDLDDKATGQTLINAYKYFKIDATKKSDVKFYMTDSGGKLARVAAATTFDLSAYTGCVQPIFQFQKSASTATDSVTLDYVRMTGRRRT